MWFRKSEIQPECCPIYHKPAGPLAIGSDLGVILQSLCGVGTNLDRTVIAHTQVPNAAIKDGQRGVKTRKRGPRLVHLGAHIGAYCVDFKFSQKSWKILIKIQELKTQLNRVTYANLYPQE